MSGSLILFASLFALSIYWSVNFPVTEATRRFSLKDKIPCTFLLILSALVMFQYLTQNYPLERWFFPR